MYVLFTELRTENVTVIRPFSRENPRLGWVKGFGYQHPADEKSQISPIGNDKQLQHGMSGAYMLQENLITRNERN